jgi:hypothetical protein
VFAGLAGATEAEAVAGPADGVSPDATELAGSWGLKSLGSKTGDVQVPE